MSGMIVISFKRLTTTFIFITVYLHFIVAQDIPFTCNQDAYFSHHESGGDFFYKFNPSFNFTLIKQLDFSVNGLAYNPNDNFIYAINESNSQIVRLDKNGDHTNLGFPTGLPGSSYWAGTFDKNGNMIISGGGDAWVVVLDVSVSPPIVLSAVEKFYSDGASGNPVFGDIAVDPISGICYSFENGSSRLVTIDLNSGAVEKIGTNTSPSSNIFGGLYFDASGELTGISLKDIYKINKVTGASTLIGEGLDINTGIDACGCLNKIQFNKSIDSSETCHGDTVIFTFSIINNSDNTFTDIQFADPLHPDLIWLGNPSNTFGGTVEIIPLASDYNLLTINEMQILPSTSEFTISALVIGSSSNFSTIYNQAKIEGFTQIWESIIDSNNPLTSDEGDATQVNISPTPSFEMNLQSLENECEGDPIALFANVPFPGEYVWETPNGGFSESQNYNQLYSTFDDSGTYNITFTDDYGCQIDSFLNIEISPSPMLNLGNDSMFCLENPFYISAGSHTNYLWQDGSTTDKFLVENYGTFAVEVMNEFGCFGIDSISFSTNCSTELFVPNAFSPNEDGQNDFFQAYGIEVVNFNLKIFDRWGAFLFESNKIEQGWNGKFRGQLKENGVYVYYINATFLDGTTIQKKGDVTLMR
ncbi:MAG: gliding motility-associated C-terminal domain-containing protein [Saprospiraceae bacterium]